MICGWDEIFVIGRRLNILGRSYSGSDKHLVLNLFAGKHQMVVQKISIRYLKHDFSKWQFFYRLIAGKWFHAKYPKNYCDVQKIASTLLPALT
ncbi:hypothetical protein Ljor_2691 [Legionella jordanis]|uniref:Uncharacterized protein n=1 Tax=Legionella jordanis TaxID=456 RepID=A0A0W0VE14_9GAMM|nr:hypothetical protein Ljor_2691 [Legionella jordanis]VEH13269.1 Uncharacterised protein [Legionella jordanis]